MTEITSIRGLAENLAEATAQLRLALTAALDIGQTEDWADQCAQTYACLKATASLAGESRLTNETPFALALSFLTQDAALCVRPEGSDIVRARRAVDAVLQRLDTKAVRVEFRTEGDRDPVLHFYENFLAVYAPEQRLRRGVFYTPRPLVRFIVRETDRLLREECGVELGLAGNVRIIDPAAGTGSFLVEVVDFLNVRAASHTNPKRKRENNTNPKRERGTINDPPSHPGSASIHSRNHPSDVIRPTQSARPGPQLIGCEILPTPCAIAQMRLTLSSVLCEDVDLPTANDALAFHEPQTRTTSERDWRTPLGISCRIHCLNSLTADVEQILFDSTGTLPEATVILGNPPYRIGAAGRSAWIDDLCTPLRAAVSGERNIQPLCDAYVQFLMLAVHAARRSPAAVVALVTNRSWLDGLIYRGLRQSVLETFQHATFVDLGGDTRQRTGRRDQNVFDVTQGVAVTLAARNPGTDLNGAFCATVRGTRLFGSRAEKLARLDSPLNFQPLFPLAPQWRLSVEDESPGVSGDRWVIQREYVQLPSLCDLMPFRSPGVKTSRDAVFYAFTRTELERQVRSAGFSWDERFAIRSLYRAGDVRWLYYDPALLGRPRPELARHVLDGETLSLITTRQFVGERFTFVGVCRGLACHGAFYLGNRGQDYQFPLWLNESEGRRPNLVLHLLPKTLRTPERFLHYATAVLHAPAYRERYLPFLKCDFPRIPLTAEMFARDERRIDELCELGSALVAAELTLFDEAHSASRNSLGRSDANIILGNSVSVGADAGSIRHEQILREQYPPGVWTFEQGGYRLAERWLKARRGARQLLDWQELERLLQSISARLKAQAALPRPL